MFLKPVESESQCHGVYFSAIASDTVQTHWWGWEPHWEESCQEKERSHYLKAKCHYQHCKQIQGVYKHSNIPSPIIHFDFCELRACNGTGGRLITLPHENFLPPTILKTLLILNLSLTAKTLSPPESRFQSYLSLR